MNNQIIYQVDSFTTSIFKGNPAGVMLLDKAISNQLMQSIAAEMNLSETAFVVNEKEHYRIKFFTPTSEIDLCGHATLASAHILYETGLIQKDTTIGFKANNDFLKVTYNKGWITMDFPVFEIKKITILEGLQKAIGTEILEVYKGNSNWLLASVKPENNLTNLNVDIALLKKQIPSLLIITSEDPEGNYDYLARCFAPNEGIDEDPVTGSAQCMLSGFWSKKLAKNEMISKQVSERSGVLKTTVKGNRVQISGEAITVFKAIFKN